MNFLSLIKTSTFKFVATKYLSYGVTLINALLIAKYLGLYFFGIYGFVTLVLQYLSYSNLGINFSFNVILSTEKKIIAKKTNEFLTATINLTIIISIILTGIFILLKMAGIFDLFSKYLFSEYYLIVLAIAILQYFNIIFINLFRIYGKLLEINFNYLIIPVGQLLCIFFYSGKDLFWTLLFSLMISNLISLLLFILNSPIKFKLKLSLSKKISNELIKRGMFLLIYNLSFYFILISARTIVSYCYSVESFGLFNFANSLTQAIMMLLGSFSFLFYPKMLNKYCALDDMNDTIMFTEKIRKIYLTVTFLIVLLSLLAAPVLFYFVPNYASSFTSFKYLLISQLILSNSFGYSTLLIQRKKETLLSIFGFITIATVISIGLISTLIFNLSFNYIALSVTIGVIFYNLLVLNAGNKITQQYKNIGILLFNVYSYKLFLPIIAYIILDFFSLNNTFNTLLTISIYFIFNYSEFVFSIREGLLIVKKDSLNISSS